MKVRYFADTDTLLIEFRSAPVAETRDLDENTILDMDADEYLFYHRRERVHARRCAPFLV